MHDAFEAVAVLQKLPLNIQCICCFSENSTRQCLQRKSFDSTLLVGTKEGPLLVYKVSDDPGTSNPIDVTLEKSIKFFSKKTIQQLYVSTELKIIVSLSDNIVSIHDLVTYQLVGTMQKTRGALMFAADLEEQVSSIGDSAYALKLCVVVKRKLQTYFWKKRDFAELRGDISLPEVPKTVIWCKDSICLGFKREYGMIKVDGSESNLQVLDSTGRLMEPVLGKIGDSLILMKDEASTFVDSDAELTYKSAFTWSDNPLAVESQPPYLIGILPKYVEVRTMEPRMLIQSIDLKPKIFCSHRNCIFVATSTYVWLLRQLALPNQIQQLEEDKQFELALHLAKQSTDEDEEDKNKRIQHIHTLLAFEQFCQKKFHESLINFAKIKTDPAQVIGLFPDMLPTDYRRQLKYPQNPPHLKGMDLEKGLFSLCSYLTEKRNETLQVSGNTISNSFPIVEENIIMQSKRQLLQVIDTTLLKCYVKINDALIAPLLRLPDNQCHLEETERVLKKAHKHRELIELYKRKGQHRKALNTLLLQSQKDTSDPSRHDDMIEYMQHLGQEQIHLIFEFSPGILRANPIEGLKIFTEDILEVETLSRSQVLDFLQGISQSLLVAYLEHVIYTWDDTTPEFHNKLLLAYKDKTLQLINECKDLLPEDDQIQVDSSNIELTETRSKLLSFLEISTSYQPDRILPEFPTNRLFEERAVLLGRNGFYQQALAIYANVLKDPIRAEDFCNKVYSEDPKNNKDVFLYLLKMYLQPEFIQEETFEVVNTETSGTMPQNLHAALRIMSNYSDKMDPEQALSLLPDDIKIDHLALFLSKSLESQTKAKHKAQVLNNLLLSENQQTNNQRMYHESTKCVITDERVCRVCKKKIGVRSKTDFPKNETTPVVVNLALTLNVALQCVCPVPKRRGGPLLLLQGSENSSCCHLIEASAETKQFNFLQFPRLFCY